MAATVTATGKRTARALLGTHGQTYAKEAGIRLRDTPQPLYQLVVLASLLSAPIRASTAVDAARALFEANLRSPSAMRDATWQQRVDALVKGHYRRLDESTATTLGKAAEFLLDRYRGDVRGLRKAADGDGQRIRRLLQEVPGLGPTGADIFLREVQDIWPEARPWTDPKVLQGAKRLDLPAEPKKLAKLVSDDEMAVFAAALVRAALDKSVVEDTRAQANGNSRSGGGR